MRNITLCLNLKNAIRIFQDLMMIFFSRNIMDILDRQDLTAFEKSSAIMKYLSGILEKQLIKQKESKYEETSEEPELKKIKPDLDLSSNEMGNMEESEMNNEPNKSDIVSDFGERNKMQTAEKDEQLHKENEDENVNKITKMREVPEDNNKQIMTSDKSTPEQSTAENTASLRPKRQRRNIKDIRRDWIYYD